MVPEAHLGMFSMLGLLGAPQKGGSRGWECRTAVQHFLACRSMLTWEEAEVAALDRQEWRRSVAQCIHFDAGWIKVKVKKHVAIHLVQHHILWPEFMIRFSTLMSEGFCEGPTPTFLANRA